MLPNKGPLTDAQRRQALINFKAYIDKWGITYAQVARQLGKPRATTIRDLVEGVFRKNADQYIRTLNNWVEQHARQQVVALQGRFVETSIAKQIHAVARMVRENQTMGLVVGPTGIGKTRCALALHDTFVGSILITIIFGSYHPKGLTRALAEKLGVRLVSKSQTDATHMTQLERVIDRLKDSNRLLIIDEAHKLQDSGLELLREIHDITGVPVLLLAIKDLHERLEKNADPDRGQLYSRFDITRPLTQGYDIHAGGRPLFTVDDIRKLYNEPSVRLSRDAEQYLQDVANMLGRGSLRLARMLVQNAARRARKRQHVADGEQVTVSADDLEYTETHLRQEPNAQEMAAGRRTRVASA